MSKYVLACLGLSLSLCLSVSSVRAQELVEPLSSPDPSPITTRPVLNEQINDTRQTYRQELETYRTLDRQYQIANEQYKQLNTLAALETAVSTTQKAMLARAKVLRSYLTLLRLQLTDATGININDKNRVLVQLDAVLTELAVHQQQIELTADRAGVSALTTDFAVLGPQIEDVAYESQALLTIGRLQTVYDKASSLAIDVNQLGSQSGSLRQAERERAYVEVQSSLAGVKELIDSVNQKATNQEQQAQFTRSRFSLVIRDLGQVYTGLSQSLSFIEELLRL